MGWLKLLLFTLSVIHCHSLSWEYHERRIYTFQQDNDCYKGQIYWCQNITTAVSCSAFKHCIEAVWEREVPIEQDKSEVCQICLDMVKQARDQLRSNETQEDLKAVLEGSCMLIPIKSVREGCKKLMQDFAVQIVDVLSSQMNPQVVCSVAGLCNNAVVHELEKKYYAENGYKGSKNQLNCNSCYSFMNMMQNELETLTPQRTTEFFGEFCRKVGSYSDGCTALVIENSNAIISALKKHIRPKPICSLAGVCKELFHNHKSMAHEVLQNPSINVVSIKTGGDLPCELCTELVVHLKSILIANTTEAEFKLILEGLCNQMKAYKDECTKIIEEYYTIFYEFLVSELDGQLLCKQIGICPGLSKTKQLLRPLVLSELEIQNSEDVMKAQLPIERLNPLTLVHSSLSSNYVGVKDKTVCAMCEYLLHFVQQEITLPSNEKKIREVVMKACDHLPRTVAAECHSFVQTYMNAFIALLANRIDPSQVCPNLGLCPGADFILVEYNDKPTCPLCLLAMEELNHKIKNNTANEINDAVDDLCLRDKFPNSLSIECVKFITDNRRAIVDMVLAEFTPQESCVFIDVCVAPNLKMETVIPAGNVETNEISDIPDKSIESPNTCTLCEFILSKLDDELKDKKTQDEIKDTVYKICSHLPKTLSSQCKHFVSEYADLIIDLLVQELEPKEVCTLLNLCGKASTVIEDVMKKCLLCELLMDGLRTVLTDKDVDDDINKNLEKACRYIPESEMSLCLSLIDQLAPQIESALRTLPVGPLVCRRIHMCENTDIENESKTLGGSDCELGSSYWCRSTETATACRKIKFCQHNVWKGFKPRKSHNKGRIVILP